MDKKLQEIRDKVAQHIRLSKEDGIYLYQSHDLLAIGEMARANKLEKTGGMSILMLTAI